MCGGAFGVPTAPAGGWGLFNTWADRATDEVIESYTMLTINADQHPLMWRMHKAKPGRPANAQDKRSVVPIEMADVDKWLAAPLADARQLLRLATEDVFNAGPMVLPAAKGQIQVSLL